MFRNVGAGLLLTASLHHLPCETLAVDFKKFKGHDFSGIQVYPLLSSLCVACFDFNVRQMCVFSMFQALGKSSALLNQRECALLAAELFAALSRRGEARRGEAARGNKGRRTLN